MRVLVIAGPTGVGKTALSVELAKELNGEIISGDSVQIYKGLDIGSAKVTVDEMDGVVHHLIDYLDVEEEYSVARFQKEVREAIEDISSRGKLPIICGGTGLYIKAALTEYEFEHKKRDLEYLKKYDDYSNEKLHERLQEVDPESAELFHPNNRRRVLRAIEYFEINGEKISTRRNANQDLFEYFILGLRMQREPLYDRINKRVDIMVENGLLKEVESLIPKREHINAIGYNELFPYFDGEYSLEEAIELIKRNSRRYAKRQFTWFSNQMKTQWIDVDELDKNGLVNTAKSLLEKNGFIR